MSQPRTALLLRRPPLLLAFPPSRLPSSALRRAPAPSKRQRSQAAAAAATPSGRIGANRAGRRDGAGPRKRSPRAPGRRTHGS